MLFCVHLALRDDFGVFLAGWRSRRPFYLVIVADWCSRRPFFAFANSSWIGAHAAHFFIFGAEPPCLMLSLAQRASFLFWEPHSRIHFGSL